MAGVSKIAELEARKRALVTESEICRETLKAEVQELMLYGIGFRKRFDQIRGVGPWVMLIAPLAGSLLSRFINKPSSRPRGSRVKGGIATALVAFRLYRKYGPVVRSLVTNLMSKGRAASEHKTPAANI